MITRDKVLLISATASVVPETVEAFLRGTPLQRRSAARERIRKAMIDLGLEAEIPTAAVAAE